MNGWMTQTLVRFNALISIPCRKSCATFVYQKVRRNSHINIKYYIAVPCMLSAPFNHIWREKDRGHFLCLQVSFFFVDWKPLFSNSQYSSSSKIHHGNWDLNTKTETIIFLGALREFNPELYWQAWSFRCRPFLRLVFGLFVQRVIYNPVMRNVKLFYFSM